MKWNNLLIMKNHTSIADLFGRGELASGWGFFESGIVAFVLTQKTQFAEDSPILDERDKIERTLNENMKNECMKEKLCIEMRFICEVTGFGQQLVMIMVWNEIHVSVR